MLKDEEIDEYFPINKKLKEMKALELTKTLAQEVKNKIRDFNKIENIPLSTDDKKKYKDQLERDGIAIISNYYSPEKCDNLKESLEEWFSDDKKIWKDEVGSDHRLHFANEYIEDIQDFYADSFINSIISSYEATSNFNGFTLANKVVPKPENKGSGRGWHRDYVKRTQTKALIYLSDVNEENGPFQYILGTHKLRSVLDVQLKINSKFDQYRFSKEDIDLLLKKTNYELKTVSGLKGTLILVDTRGLHRGKPIEEGVRYALTNYYWFKTSIPKHIMRMKKDITTSK